MLRKKLRFSVMFWLAANTYGGERVSSEIFTYEGGKVFEKTKRNCL